MRKFALIGLVIAGLLLTSNVVFAADNMAYVDLEQLHKEYKKAKGYNDVLEAKQKKFEGDREAKVEEIRKLQEKLSLLSDEEREARRSELEEKVTAIQEFDRDANQDFRKEMTEKGQEVFDDIKGVIETYAKKEGLDFIFVKHALVYENKKLDITEPILKILNK